MRILVMGGAGYIGSHTVKVLKKAGHTVIVFDSLESGHPNSLPGFAIGKDLIVGDILDQSALDQVFGNHDFDAVIHFAAYIEVEESVREPGRFFWNNTAGTINLLNTMAKHKVNEIIFSSTAAVYGDIKTSPVTESTPAQPINPYGTSKLLAEEIIRDFTTFTSMRATVFRYFNACGADPEGELGEDHTLQTHLISQLYEVVLGNKDAIKIFGTDYPTPDGTAIRDYIHVQDLACVHVLALEAQVKSLEKFRIYNVGTQTGYSVKEIIETCRTVTGHPVPAIESPRRPGDPAQIVADTTKINKALRWEPEYSDLVTILKTGWEWRKKNPQGYNDKKKKP